MFDPFNERVYIFSHPTKDATVIDAKDGTVIGTIDLGGVPEQGVSDGKGTLYVVMQDPQGSVTVVDMKTMKATAHYPFGDHGGCNGLALDVKNRVLFAACARAGTPPQRHTGADDGDLERRRTGRFSPSCHSPAAPTALCSIQRRWRHSARTATAR